MKTLLEAAQDYFNLDPGDTGYTEAKTALWDAMEALKDDGESKPTTKGKWPMLGLWYYRAKDNGAYMPVTMIKHFSTGEVFVGYASVQGGHMVAVPLTQWSEEFRPQQTMDNDNETK